MKKQLCLERHRARGLERIIIHALLSIIAMFLTALVALRLNRLEKVRCITMLARYRKLTERNRFSNRLARALTFLNLDPEL